MKPTLAFDVYGTLIDTSGVLTTLQALVDYDAPVFMETWRSKQLEYSFRRGLMNSYVDFSVVTRQALAYCCQRFDQEFSASEIRGLMEAYKVLPAFADARQALLQLDARHYAKYAFSNGSHEAVHQLLENAHIQSLMDGIVSVEATKMFKPSPKVYQYFMDRTASKKERTWLISGNPFDVLGALEFGMKGIWVKRSERSVFDPWGPQPTAIISDLTELGSII